jgi:hypothetical protein
MSINLKRSFSRVEDICTAGGKSEVSMEETVPN